jgi:nucleotide-binding universal stress UspA family protein
MSTADRAVCPHFRPLGTICAECNRDDIIDQLADQAEVDEDRAIRSAQWMLILNALLDVYGVAVEHQVMHPGDPEAEEMRQLARESLLTHAGIRA